MEQLLRSFSVSFICLLDRYYARTEIEKIKMRYGLEVILDNVSKSIGYVIISVLLGCFQEMLIVLAAFGLLRLCAGGVHLDSSISCFITTSSVVVGGALVGMNFQVSKTAFLITMMVLIILALLYAPSGTIDYPVKPESKRRYKYITILLLVVFGIIGLFASNVVMTLILIGCGSEIITILKFLNKKYL